MKPATQRRLLWTLFVLAVLSAVAYMALNWYEVEDTETWIGMQGEAAVNRYLALERTLNKMGAKTERVNGHEAWDRLLQAAPRGATLLLGDRRLVRMSPTRVAQIKEWVSRGGNLVVEAEMPRFDDPLLASFGIGHIALRMTKDGWKEVPERRRQGVKKPDAEDDTDINIDPETFENMPEGSELSRAIREVLLRKQYARIVLVDGAGFDLEHRPTRNLRPRDTLPQDAFVSRDDAGPRVIQLAHGAGRVTAFSEFDFLAQREIGERDHAELIWHVVSTQNAGQNAAPIATQPTENAVSPSSPRVFLALRETGGGLMLWLAQHAWMAVIAFVVLLLFWIARVVRRFGPLAVPAPLDRRSLGEHFRAVGRFLASENAWAALAEAARERFLKRLYRERPGLSRADRQTLLESLEKLSGLGIARIQRSLEGSVKDKRTFTDVVRALKALEQALDHHRTTVARSA
jgi:hypothetical protein